MKQSPSIRGWSTKTLQKAYIDRNLKKWNKVSAQVRLDTKENLSVPLARATSPVKSLCPPVENPTPAGCSREGNKGP